MDFGTLLSTAQRNEQGNRKEVRYYSTKFEPPKKEQRTKSLSTNIKNFLAKKEAEEKRRSEKERKKRDELLALRAKDKKATRRVSVMLKRTKSANQSVIQDAVDKDNTAVTLVGPSQPDEDDYGYVSQEAAAFYNKMMEKYSKMPDEPKFSLAKKKVSANLSSTKDRVKAALEREKEEAMMPHRRKRKHKEDAAERHDEVQDEEERIESTVVVKPKPKPAPPPMNFTDLLKMAEKKQYEPIVIEPKNLKDEERPLTKKQKKELEREREWRERREKGLAGNPVVDKNRIPKLESKPAGDRIPKIDNKPAPIRIPKIENKPKPESARREELAKTPRPIEARPPQNRINGAAGPSPNKIPKPSDVADRLSKSACNPSKTIRHVDKLEKVGGNSSAYKPPARLENRLINGSGGGPLRAMGKPSSSERNSGDVRYKMSGEKSQQRPPNGGAPAMVKQQIAAVRDQKPKPFPPADLPSSKQSTMKSVKPKQFPPGDLRPKQFPPGDVRRREPVRPKQLAVKKGRILDDEDEYDSEMDDFIDDGPLDQEDYSKYISEIFGYDKSKYRYMDDDDDDVDNMESTFAQQMKEEVISTKIGIMEDLEDMRKEEEAKKRKALMKKHRS